METAWAFYDIDGALVNGILGAWKFVDATGAVIGGGANLPAGTIVMWSGLVGSIPTGWTLCDGTLGTPDLRDRFVRGRI